MITFTPEESGKTPLYQQLYSYIKKEIESGNIKSGEKLPSKRSLSAHIKVSIVTVETAYAQLMAEGYIKSKPGSGFYVEENYFSSEPRQPGYYVPPTDEILYDFRTNCVDTSDFPFSVWAKLSREVLSEKDSDLLNPCDPRGILSLRTAIASYLKSFRGMTVSPEQIVIGAGSEYLTGLIIQLLGRDNAYGVENPGYRKIYDIFSANTSRVFPVPMDERGADADAISGFGINVIHVTPSHHFPLGIIMPIARRQELLRWAYSSDERYIIEDDYDSEFFYSGRPVPTIESLDKMGRVIYINTFTKSLAPSMRISYMVIPEQLCSKFSSRLGFYSCTVPVFEQLTLAKFIRGGYFERHINRMRRIYKERRDILCKKITEGSLGKFTELSGSEAGMHILLTVHNGMTGNRLLSAAQKEGVRVYGLSEYYSFPVSVVPENTVIAGFSGLNSEQIEKGIEALERAWT